MKYLAKIGIGFSLLLSLVACTDDDEFSDVPELVFKEFKKIETNKAVWTLGFTDGDGDLGVRNDKDPDNFIGTIHRIDDGIETVIPNSILKANYRIPVIKNVPISDGVEGEVEFTIETNAYLLFNPPIDSMFISGFVIDRANNESNVVRTPIFRTN